MNVLLRKNNGNETYIEGYYLENQFRLESVPMWTSEPRIRSHSITVVCDRLLTRSINLICN